MLESVKYALEVSWYLFLFIPLIFAIACVICLGICALVAIYTNCYKPCFDNWRLQNSRLKLKLHEDELLRNEIDRKYGAEEVTNE